MKSVVFLAALALSTMSYAIDEEQQKLPRAAIIRQRLYTAGFRHFEEMTGISYGFDSVNCSNPEVLAERFEVYAAMYKDRFGARPTTPDHIISCILQDQFAIKQKAIESYMTLLERKLREEREKFMILQVAKS